MAGPPGYTRINNTDLETQQESNSYELHDIHDIEYPPKNTDLASQPESNFSLFKLSKAAQTNSQVKIFGRDDIFLFEFDPSDGFEKLREYIAFKLSELNLEEEYLNFQIGYISTTLIHVSTDYDLGAYIHSSGFL